ncbi:hypothetical protein MGN70_004159 [Eutypa lata]|nr:hypothetical protein MGN70_004159 [Eutypa lata]
MSHPSAAPSWWSWIGVFRCLWDLLDQDEKGLENDMDQNRPSQSSAQQTAFTIHIHDDTTQRPRSEPNTPGRAGINVPDEPNHTNERTLRPSPTEPTERRRRPTPTDFTRRPTSPADRPHPPTDLTRQTTPPADLDRTRRTTSPNEPPNEPNRITGE